MSHRIRLLSICLACLSLGGVPIIGVEPNASITATFAYWDSDELWYPAKVESAEGPKTLVRYYDGTTEWKEKPKIIEHKLRAGARVYAKWQNAGSYYAGKIASIDGDRIRIRYDDGDVEDTTIGAIRMNLENMAMLQVGVRVFARWDADGYWYPASIVEIKDKRYQVRFDDGQQVWSDEDGLCKYAVTPGDRVEGNWISQGYYYPGEVMSKKGKQIHIRYDDGDEEDTTVDLVRMQLRVGGRGD